MSAKCHFQHCVGVPPEGRDYCSVHVPEKVIERSVAIVDKHFHNWDGLTKLSDIHQRIIKDLQATV